MKMFKTLLLALLVVGCSSEPETDLAGLQAMRDQWQAAFDATDAAAIAALYAANGTVHPPNAKKAMGRRAIEAFWQEFLSSGLGAEISDSEVYASGDVGYKIGTYMITDAAGAPADIGKYVEVWRFIDGRWQMLHDIYNSDMPLPAPPPPAPPEADDEAEVFDDEEMIEDEEALMDEEG
jgi:ketosteroid isomerase-like protein